MNKSLTLLAFALGLAALAPAQDKMSDGKMSDGKMADGKMTSDKKM